MRLVTLVAAWGLLSTAADASSREKRISQLRKAAIRRGTKNEQQPQHQQQSGRENDAPSRWGTTTTDNIPALGIKPGAHLAKMLVLDPEHPGELRTVIVACPGPSVIVSTMTVDVTVFITATPAFQQACESTPTSTTEPCTEETVAHTPTPTSEICTEETTVTSTSTEPCTEETVAHTPTPTSEPCTEETVAHTPTPTSEPCTEETPTPTPTTEPCTEETVAHTPTPTSEPCTETPTPTTEPCEETVTHVPITTESCTEENAAGIPTATSAHGLQEIEGLAPGNTFYAQAYTQVKPTSHVIVDGTEQEDSSPAIESYNESESISKSMTATQFWRRAESTARPRVQNH